MSARRRAPRLAAALAVLLGGACEGEAPPSRPPVIDPSRDAGPPPTCAEPPGRTPGARPCQCTSDCAGDRPFCATEALIGIPGGSCVVRCDVDAEDPDAACGPGSRCAPTGSAPGAGLCVEPCATSADCTPPGVCNAFGQCRRFCSDDAACDSGLCDRWTGECVLSPRSGAGGGHLAPCLRDDDCRSRLCIELVDGGDRLCVASCDVTREDACPDGATCIGTVAGSDLGLCAPPCVGEALECAAGLRCQRWNLPTPGLLVCLPPLG